MQLIDFFAQFKFIQLGSAGNAVNRLVTQSKYVQRGSAGNAAN